MRFFGVPLVALPLWLVGCAATGPNLGAHPGFTTDSTVAVGDSVVTFFALGDWGTGNEQQLAVARAFEEVIEGLEPERLAPPFVVAPGDNVYEVGLKSGWGDPTTDELLRRTFGVPYGSITWAGEPLDFHIVPGNHDYGAGYGTGARDSGYGDVVHHETTAEGRYPGFHYYPLSYPGKPDSNDEVEYQDIRTAAEALGGVAPLPESMTRPERMALDPSLPVDIFAIDSQAMMERLSKRGDDVNSPSWDRLDSLLSASDKPWKFVIGHHPIDTYSGHGSHQTFGNWVWTGTRGAVSRSFTGPRVALLSTGVFIGALISPIGWALAGAGLLMAPASVVVDKIHKHPQDTDYWSYAQFAENLERIAHKHDALIISGHDHNLQLIRLSDRAMQVVSGSAGKVSWVAGRGGDLLYSASKPGFVRFDATEDQLWMQFCTVEVRAPTAVCDVTFTLPAGRGEAASNQ